MSVVVCKYVTKQSQWLQGCYGPNSVVKPNAATALAVASKNSANGYTVALEGTHPRQWKKSDFTGS